MYKIIVLNVTRDMNVTFPFLLQMRTGTDFHLKCILFNRTKPGRYSSNKKNNINMKYTMKAR